MNLVIDPTMYYCVNCNDEYMPEASKCGVCGAELISGEALLAQRQNEQAKLASRLGELTPADQIVTICRDEVYEVKRIEQLLKAENIGTLITGEESSCGKGCCGGRVELKVRVQDVQAAMAVIEADLDRTTASHEHKAFADYGFDQAAAEHTCPACGATFVVNGNTCPDCGLCFG